MKHKLHKRVDIVVIVSCCTKIKTYFISINIHQIHLYLLYMYFIIYSSSIIIFHQERNDFFMRFFKVIF